MPPDEGFGPYHKDRGEKVAEVPHEGREQPTIEGPKTRTLDLPSRHDDLLAQEQVLGDERGAGGQDREQEVSQKLQEGGDGSSGLTMGRAWEVAYGDHPHFPPDGFIAAVRRFETAPPETRLPTSFGSRSRTSGKSSDLRHLRIAVISSEPSWPRTKTP